MDSDSRERRREFTIPKCSAEAFIVHEGETLRVTAHEGKQVADIKFLNAHNYEEQFSAWWSAIINSLEGRGGTKNIEVLYSNPPWEREMLTVVDDPVGDHFMDGSCSHKISEIFPGTPPNETCMDLYAECLRPYGLTMKDLIGSGTFNVFMSAVYNDDEHGTIEFRPPQCEKGDYIEFKAEMDVLVAATSCPQENEVNDYEPKSMKYDIYE